MLVVGALRIAGDGGDGREDDAPLRTEVARRSLTASLTRTYGGVRALLHRRDLGCALRALRRGALELDDPDVGSARSGRRREGEPRRLKLVDQEAGARARGWPRRERGRGRASPLHRAIRAICDESRSLWTRRKVRRFHESARERSHRSQRETSFPGPRVFLAQSRDFIREKNPRSGDSMGTPILTGTASPISPGPDRPSRGRRRGGRRKRRARVRARRARAR